MKLSKPVFWMMALSLVVLAYVSVYQDYVIWQQRRVIKVLAKDVGIEMAKSRQLPEHVKVRNEEWRVNQSKDNPILSPMGPYVLLFSGYTDDTRKIIHIDPTDSLEDTKETIVHELLHANLGIAFSDQLMTGHEAIYRTAPAVVDIVKNNPDIVKYIQRTSDHGGKDAAVCSVKPEGTAKK